LNSILVVCEGNICRSPMAEGLLAAALPAFRVRSAGLGALVGEPADKAAIQLMQDRGIDIGGHRALQVSRQLCVDSDIVLVMDRSQRQRLQGLYPEVRGRVFRLAESLDLDVPDPYRQPMAAFRTALSIIDEGVEQWLRRIHRL
jgi:protein-tyrosine phosphatase